jgi:hypothetical protein
MKIDLNLQKVAQTTTFLLYINATNSLTKCKFPNSTRFKINQNLNILEVVFQMPPWAADSDKKRKDVIA